MMRTVNYAAVAALALALGGCPRSSHSGAEAGNLAVRSASTTGALPTPAPSETLPGGLRSKVKGTPFSMVVPLGFVPSSRFDGFSGPDESTMVMFTALPVPAHKLDGMWKSDAMRKQGMALVRKEPVRFSGVDAELALVAQQVSGMQFEKWILRFPAGEETFLCVAAYPSTQSELFRSRLRDSLLSISYEPNDTVASSPAFHVDVRGLKLAHRLSKTEMYTVDGNVQKLSPGAPLLVVGPSVAKISSNNRQRYSEERLRQTAHTTIGEIAASGALVIDGLAGYESVATATDKSSGVPMTAYQVMLFADDHYFIIQGLVGRDQAADYLPVFKQAARSFRRAR